MISHTMLFMLLALFYSPVHSATVDYEPIKITVNENFNAQPNLGALGLPGSLAPNFLHQGANFFFNPQMQYAPGYMPSHLEALMTMINQHNIPPMGGPSKVVIEEKIEEKVTGIFPEPIPLPGIIPIQEDIVEIVETPQPNPVEIIVEENFEVVPPAQTIIEEEIVVIPEAPKLPPLSPPSIIFPVFEDVLKPAEVIVEESIDFIPEFPQFDEIIHTNQCGKCIFSNDEYLPPIILPKPQDKITSVPIIAQFETYAPFVNGRKPFLVRKPGHRSKSRKPTIAFPKAAILPIGSHPRKSINLISMRNAEEKDKISYYTDCAHEIVAERIAPHILFKNRSSKHG